MKKLYNTPIFKTGLLLIALLLLSCGETKKEDAAVKEKEVPMLELASQEYSDLALKSLELIAEFNFEEWKEYLADDVEWFWPDGNSKTRHTIKGKEALVAWWIDWKEKTGGQLKFENNTFLPIKVNKPSNHYKLVGTGVLSYTDLTISIGDKSASVRQNIVFMFNDDKKITHALLYYDRTGIIELTNVVFGEPKK